MDFLKEILGEELFAQVTEKVNAYNGDEANKDKQIKLANLGGGDYVGKGKFEGLQEQLTGKTNELTEATNLIAELKKSTKGSEELQNKIAEYEKTTAELQAELQETKLKSAIKVALLSDKAVDVDYLTFKLNEKMKDEGKTLELDDNENIKGWDDIAKGLKVQFPTQFESEKEGDKKILDPNKLPKSEGKDKMTKEEFFKKPYAERAAFQESNPDAYSEMMKG